MRGRGLGWGRGIGLKEVVLCQKNYITVNYFRGLKTAGARSEATSEKLLVM